MKKRRRICFSLLLVLCLLFVAGAYVFAANGTIEVNVESDLYGELARFEQDIFYTVKVTNTGSVAVSNIGLSDTTGRATPVGSAVIDNLDPGDFEEVEFKQTVTEEDIIAKRIELTVSASGVDAEGGTTNANGWREDETEDVDNTIDVSVESDLNGDAACFGQTITYTVTVENQGNVTVSNIEVNDELNGAKLAAGETGIISSLKPGMSADVRFTYIVSAEDAITGTITNNVSASGLDPLNNIASGSNQTEDTTSNAFTAKFNTNGHGTAPADGSYAYENKITKPTDPTADGYTFKGWYKEAACTNAWDFDTDTMPAGGVTLYAKWTANTYTVEYNANGHGTAPADESVACGAKVTKPTDPTADGYIFKGWYKEATCENAWDFDAYTMPAGGVTLYAKWVPTEYSVAVTAPANGSVTADKAKACKDDTVSLTVTPATGYKLKSLTVKDAGENSVTVTDNAFTMPGTNVTVAAEFEPCTYAVTYEDQSNAVFSGTHESGYPTAHTYGTATALKSASKDYYDFGGWFTASDCSGTAVTSLGATDYTADITLYAKWTPTEYTVTVTAPTNGTVTAATAKACKDDTVSLTVTPATGYKLKSLTVKDAGEDPVTVTDNAFTMPGSNVSVTAEFEPCTYAVTYKDQSNAAFSGTHESGYPTAHTYGTATALKSADKDYYDFGGWFTASDCSGSAVTSLGATDYTADITLYAKWTPTEYTVTVTAPANGSVTADKAKACKDDTVSLTVTPATGYKLKSLTVKDAGEDPATVTDNAFTMPGSNVSVTAEFEPCTYAVTYKDQSNAAFSGMHESGYPTAHTYGTATALKSASRMGYRFDGWFTSPDCSGSAVTSLGAADFTADLTLYAAWTADSLEYTIINGAGSTWTKGSTEGCLIVSDAPFAKFTGVKVDNALLAAENYTAEEGSTEITMKPDYLETLNVGKHRVEILSSDGSAVTTFTVKVKTTPNSPKTGVFFPAIALSAACGGAFFGTVVRGKKKAE